MHLKHCKIALFQPEIEEGLLSKFDVIDPTTIFKIKMCYIHRLPIPFPDRCVFPQEIVLYIYAHYINDASTVCAFQKAFGWEKLDCQHLFCQQMACQLWKEDRLDTVTVADTEYTKIVHYQQDHIMFHPSIYHIQRVSDGFTMTTYKTRHFDRHGQNTQFQFNSYIAFNLIHIYDPHFAKHNLKLSKPIPKSLLQNYYPIKMFFKKKQPYIRSVVIDKNTPSAMFTMDSSHPCVEWAQVLYDTYKFQKKYSDILQGLKRKVQFF